MSDAVLARMESLLSEDHAHARARGLALADESIGGRPVVLHGAGNLGRKVARVLREHGRAAVAFSDNNRALWGSTLEGAPVFAPDEAVRRYGESAAFVVCVWSPGAGYLAARDQLRRMGVANVLPAPALFWTYRDYLLPFYLFAPPEYFIENAKELLAAYALLDDPTSRLHYAGQVAWRLSMDYEVLEPPVGGPQYFPPDLVTLSDSEDFVDCGAFDGDTLRSLLAACGGRFGSYEAFEPDPDAFQRLSGYAGSLEAAVRGRIRLTPAAVGCETGPLRFDASGEGSSRASDTGSNEVACIRLDEAVERATYVKMDIEGAEAAALAGARALIERCSPRLAVCLYHAPADIFSLSAQVAALVPDHRMACRAHVHDGLDLVLYAVPR